MYQTLTGKRANIQQIKDISQLCNLQSKMVNSQPSLTPQNTKMSIEGLTKMLQIRNKRYKNNQAFNQYDLPFRISGTYKAQQVSKSKKESKDKKQIRDILSYGYQELQECLQNICQQYCSFSLHSQIKIQQDNVTTQKNINFPQIARGLRQLNIQQINNTNTQIGTSLRLIRYCGMATPYFQQLVRQIELTKQNQGQDASILLKIFQSFGTIITEGILFQYLSQLQAKKNKDNDQKWKYILLLFLVDYPQSRANLNRFLYEQNQSQIFQLIDQYDNFLDKNSEKKYQLNQLLQYSQRLDTLCQKQRSIYCKKLTSIMNFQHVINLQKQFGQFAIQFQNVVVLGIINTLKWLQVKFKLASDALQFKHIICNNFKIIRDQISQIFLFQSQPAQFKSLMQLKLLNYTQSFSLIQNYQQRLFLTLLICNERKAMQKLFNLSIICSNSTRQQRLIQKFQAQLCRQLKQFFFDHTHIDFIIDCTKFIRLEDKIDLLLSSKSMVQSIDWHHLCSLNQKQQIKQLMRSIILGSIKMYHNTGVFLNTGIPIQKYLPYFQIQILIHGLIKVLMQDVKLNQKQKSKFFGMISIFRGENLTEKYQFFMTILQMLFQWYVLRQSMLQQDYKSLGLSLKSNLQQNSGQIQMLSNSVTLTESAKTNSILKIHNHEYIKKIGSPQFMQKISQYQQFQPLYVNFLHTIIESICKAKNNRQKKFIRQKIYQWVQTYMRKLDDNMKRSKGQFYRKLNKLRQKSYSLTSLHQI